MNGQKGNAGISCAGAWMVKPVTTMPSWLSVTRELPETAQVQFNNARQTPDELLEDWADRVLSLATRAIRDLPETHMYQQTLVRLCQGAADKETGSYASNSRPKNIEEAIDRMRWFQ